MKSVKQGIIMKKNAVFLVLLLLFSSLFAKVINSDLPQLTERESQSPQNVILNIVGNNIVISWDSIPVATDYKIYASDMPYGTYIDVSSAGTFSANTWTTALSNGSQKFYYVTSLFKGNLNIEVYEGVVILSWESIPNASSYKIYSSDEINGTFSEVSDSGTFNGSSWVQNISQADLKFYYFTAIVDNMETDASEEVGFKKFSCQTTDTTDLNFIALPFSQNGMLASEFAQSIGNCDAVSKWNAEKQSWESANNADYKWLNDFQVQDGYQYMINVTETRNIYVAGKIIQQPNYNLITTSGTDLNTIMVPLDRNDLTQASQLGEDIEGCESVAEFNASDQQWFQVCPCPFGWSGDFPITLGQSLFISVTEDTVWPSPSKKW